MTDTAEITDVEESHSLWLNLKPPESSTVMTLYMTFGQSIELDLPGIEPVDLEGDDLYRYASDSENHKLLLWCSGESRDSFKLYSEQL